jgi:hypothetical protein
MQRSYSEIADPWNVDDTQESYCSPQPTAEVADTQMLIFNEWFQNGRLSVKLEVGSQEELTAGRHIRVAALCFRFRNSKQYYFAGIGALWKQILYRQVYERNLPADSGVG